MRTKETLTCTAKANRRRRRPRDFCYYSRSKKVHFRPLLSFLWLARFSRDGFFSLYRMYLFVSHILLCAVSIPYSVCTTRFDNPQQPVLPIRFLLLASTSHSTHTHTEFHNAHSKNNGLRCLQRQRVKPRRRQRPRNDCPRQETGQRKGGNTPRIRAPGTSSLAQQGGGCRNEWRRGCGTNSQYGSLSSRDEE